MEISVLSPLVAVKHPDEIVIGRDGLLAVSGKRRGTLLPQVAVEHGFDAGAFVRRTLRKAGLPEDAIERGEDVLLYRYEAQVLTAADLR
jgi:AMMECR1 domain-containing protein